MEIIETKDAWSYSKDLKYWCNACGELHHHGEYDITEDELPKELSRAYNGLWSDSTGSLCYLVEYKGEYGIALINEFDEEFAKNTDVSMNALYACMKTRAEEYSTMNEFKDTKILLFNGCGIQDCHEFVVLLPCDTPKETFDRIADILYKTVYEKGQAADILQKEATVRPTEDELRVTGLFYMKTLHGETKEEAEERFLNAIYAAGLDVCNASLKYELESEQDKEIERE